MATSASQAALPHSPAFRPTDHPIKWDPISVLQIPNEERYNEFTCLGFTKQMKRCKWTASQHGQVKAYAIFDILALRYPNFVEMEGELRRAARAGLCNEFHSHRTPQNHVDWVLAKWKTRMAQFTARTEDNALNNRVSIELLSEVFVGLLVEDDELKALLVTEAERSDTRTSHLNTFAPNLRHLLEIFASTLYKELSSLGHWSVASLIDRDAELLAQRIHSKALVHRRFIGIAKLSEVLKQYKVNVEEEKEADEEEQEEGEEEEEKASKAQQDGSVFKLELRDLITGGRAFARLRDGLRDLVAPTYATRLRLALLSNPEHVRINPRQWSHYDSEDLIAELQHVSPQDITFEFDIGKQKLKDRMKSKVEDMTGTKWDWWPLDPCLRPLKKNEILLKWQCACGKQHWKAMPLVLGRALRYSLPKMDPGMTSRENGNPIETVQRPVPVRHVPGIEHSEATNTPQPSSASTSHNSSHEAGRNAKASRNQLDNSSAQAGSDISVYPNAMSRPFNHAWKALYVFLLVRVGADYEVAQIAVDVKMKNKAFYKKMRAEYFRLRGFFRSWLSVWKFSHCEFYKCNKFEESFVGPLGRDFPRPHHRDYEYSPRPMDHIPPISPTQFHHSFYACFSKKPHLCRFHRCRTVSGMSSEAILKLPKRQSALVFGSDDTEIFFGIFARETPSAYAVIIYNALALLPSMCFFFLWLFYWGHSGDLQNASVPLTLTITLLVAFWSFFIESLYSPRDASSSLT